MALLKKSFLLCAVLCLVYGQCSAQFLWGSVGTPIREYYSADLPVMTAANHHGDVYVAWYELRSGHPGVYCQRFNAQGQRLWAQDVLVYRGYCEQMVINLTSDDGVVVAWGYYDYWHFYGVLTAQKVSRSGVAQWAPNGITVGFYNEYFDHNRDAVREGTSSCYNLTADSSGGMFFVWEGGTSQMPGVVAQHRKGEGTLASGWVEYGNPFQSGGTFLENTSFRQCVCSDGAGGIILSWAIGYPQHLCYGQRVDGEANRLWGVNGLLLSSNGIQASVCRDEAGGAYFVWGGASTNSLLYMQRVNHQGSIYWADQGLPVAPASPMQQYIARLVPDGEGGALAAWTTGDDIWSQRISPAGIGVWTNQGAPLSTATGTQNYVQIEGDGNGGLFAAWQSYTSYLVQDAYSQHLNANGQPIWPAGGVALRTGSTKSVSGISLARTTGADVMYSWNERRQGLEGNYLQKTNETGQIQFGSGGLTIAEVLHGMIEDASLAAISSNRYLSVWRDNRNNINSTSRIYYQVFDSLGAMLLPSDGVPIFIHGNADQNGANVAATSDGGAVICWLDYRNMGGNYTIWAQKVDSQGNPLWAEGGVSLITPLSLASYPLACSDEAGGVQIVFKKGYNLYMQHLDANGNRLLGVSGAQLSSSASNIYPIKILPDGQGGSLVISNRDPQGGIFVRRVLLSGLVAWTDTVSLNANNTDHDAVSDVSGGLVVVYAASQPYDIYAQKIDLSGHQLWGPGGTVVSNSPQVDHAPTLVEDSGGNVYIAWTKGYGDIYCQRLNPSGIRLFTPDGILVSSVTGEQGGPLMVRDNFDGALITWGEWVNNAQNQRITHLNSHGQIANPIWIPGGNLFSPIYGGVDGAWAIAQDGAGGAVVTFNDMRGYCAQRVNDYLTADQAPLASRPAEILHLTNCPNPFNSKTALSFKLQAPSRVGLKVYDTAGRLVATLVDGWREEGTHEVTFDGSKLASGVYLVRLEAGEFLSVQKMVLMK